MHFERVEVSDFRNLSSLSLFPIAGLNILEGKNGSGKSSFLEALYMLAMARSFRTSKSSKLIRYGQDSFTLFAQFLNGHQEHRLGIKRHLDNRTQIKLDGTNLRARSEVVQLLPIQLITPESILLITGSPGERRQFLDWIMFHVEPTFGSIWSRYQRLLKHRNVLLRESKVEELMYWDEGIVQEGKYLDRFRRLAVEQLHIYLNQYLQILLPEISISMSYRQGWRSGLSLTEALSANKDADLTHKYTTAGPHRADIALLINKQKVADVLSRGQLKLLLCALKLAQLDFIKEATGKAPVVLIDDLPAELDFDHRKILLSLLHDLQNQVFVTTTDRSHLDSSSWKEVKVFHVEHGKIKEVV